MLTYVFYDVYFQRFVWLVAFEKLDKNWFEVHAK
jgi:hypothetical protein